MIRGLFIFLLIGLSQCLNAQIVSNQFLPFFMTNKIGNHVNAQWRTGIDFTCNDVDLYFGMASNALEPIYSYPSVCGGPTEEIDYNYIHNFPPKGILYYQLRLGIFGRTYVQVLDNSVASTYMVYPNPVRNTCNIEFDEIETGYVSLRIYNYGGNVLKSISIPVNDPIVDLSFLPSGLYFFTATFSNYGKIVQGKINEI